jgi:hypothetical protein
VLIIPFCALIVVVPNTKAGIDGANQTTRWLPALGASNVIKYQWSVLYSEQTTTPSSNSIYIIEPVEWLNSVIMALQQFLFTADMKNLTEMILKFLILIKPFQEKTI